MEADRNHMPHIEPGDCIGGRYRIAAPIGRGGMGSVYLAEDLRLQGKLRALKLTAALPGDREAFIREASLLSALSHPLLPDIVDYYPPGEDGKAVIVMDYVAGESLGELFLRCGRRLPFARVRHYLEQLGEALCYLHAQRPQIVFRDLKPANVMIDSRDQAILVDFGIARPYRPEAAADTERLGTPAFAAPEQIAGRQTDARSDLYSWGALAFYLLSGGQAAIQYPAGRHAGRLQDDVPGAFRDLLEEVLAEAPEARPQSAEALLGRMRRTASAGPDETAAVATMADAASFVRGARETGVAVAAVLSAYPGAGATLATLGLSRLLSEEGVHHAVVECPGGEPELHALLNGGRQMPARAAFADPSGTGPATPAWRRESAAYYPLDPNEPGMRAPEERFAAWLHRLGVPVVLLDVSSRWRAAGVAALLATGGLHSVWWVADCLPAKWTPQLQREAAALQAKAASCGASAGWIANRDHRFAQRGDWLACFPAAPAACIPWLPAADIVQAVWRGEGYPARIPASGPVRRAFRNWALRAGLLPGVPRHFPALPES